MSSPYEREREYASTVKAMTTIELLRECYRSLWHDHARPHALNPDLCSRCQLLDTLSERLGEMYPEVSP